jgi:hypothetical protein
VSVDFPFGRPRSMTPNEALDLLESQLDIPKTLRFDNLSVEQMALLEAIEVLKEYHD